MPTAENAKLQYEAGQNVTAMSALTNSGDHKTFTSAETIWSKKSGFDPNVKPNGLATGGVVAPNVSNNAIDIAAQSCYLVGVKTTVGADAARTVVRAATNVASISSVTITSAGAVAMVKGADSASAAFSEVRGAAGGPPYILVGSIEIAQIRTTSNAAAVILASEVFSVVGVHQERFDYPVWETETEQGQITFADALPLIHTADVPKIVAASYSGPIFSDVPLTSDFVPPENSHSVSSEQVYGQTLGSSSSSLGQGSFTARLEDGVSDAMVREKDQILWFKFFPDRYKTNYLLAQGKLGINRTFPAGGSIQAACTISAEKIGLEVEA
jgi:hypothetical protein